MARGNWHVEHLLRRAGFGPSADDLARFEESSISLAVDYLVDYERLPDDVDSKIGQCSVRRRHHARPVLAQHEHRRLSPAVAFPHGALARPLQEKMALFWHNHFATGYSKVAGVFGAIQGTKMMALKSGELPGPQGRSSCSASTRSAAFATC
jgi:hypothetical protein